MGWQAEESWPGGTPGHDDGLGGPAAGFGHGGAWEKAAPCAALAAALEAAAGPGDLYQDADTDTLTGIARQWAALESWAAAGLLGALRAMTGEDGAGEPRLRRRADLPGGWDDSLTYEVAGALAMGPVSAGNLAVLAWTLGTRLPGTGRLLADGALTRAKAKLVATIFEPLDDSEAARAEALVLPELPGKTYPQIERLAWQAALAVAPDVAERRRSAAERDRARVTVFREESGAVGLSGRDLPAAPALSGHACVLARARDYEASGAFGGHSGSSLQALAYTDLLNGVSAADRIAFARDAAEPPGTGHQEDGGSGPEQDDGGDVRGRDGGEPDGGADPDGGPRPGGGGTPGGGGPDDGPHGGAGNQGDSQGPDDGGGNQHGAAGPAGSTGAAGPAGLPVLPEVTAPLVTLQGQAERPGDSRLLGPLDPALVRALAADAARSPASRWEVTIVDEHGYAAGHAVARPGRARRQPPQPRGPDRCALPARVNITVTRTLLQQMAAQPRPGAPPGGWALVPRAADQGDGTWALVLPGGRELAVRFDAVPVYSCGHQYWTAAYEPGDRLRRLVQVRDYQCTFPTCSRPARESDFEHAVPYDQGGATCACNAGARSRRCHQVKQLPGWSVTQPRPGWHVWTTPTGRAYVQEPWRYPA